MTDLQDKAIDFKGHKYVLVSDRIVAFNADYKNGSIRTEMLSGADAKMVIIKALVVPDVSKPERFFTGHSQATWGDSYINKTSALENAETSAIGRALGMMGIGVIDAVASIDEIKKAEAQSHNTRVIEGLSGEEEHLATTQDERDMAASVGSEGEIRADYCPIHGATMKERIYNDAHYWDHRKKEGEGDSEVWFKCSGQGWKPSKNFKRAA